MSNRKVVVLGTPGYVREPARFNDETLLNIIGQNSGNLMFQYAATQIIDCDKSHVGLSEQAYGSPEAFARASYLVFPAANHLRAGADWKGLNDFLSRSKLPIIVFGLGAQSPKIGGETTTIRALKADAHVSRMVDIFKDKAAFISVRGDFTKSVCDDFGLNDVQVLGCPSALLSPDPQLGQKLASRLAEVTRTDTQPRFGLAAAAPFEIRANEELRSLERKLFQWVRSRGGPYFQQSGGEATMRLCRKDSERPAAAQIQAIRDILQPGADLEPFAAFFERLGRFHLSAPEWMAETKDLAFVIGTRVHGNMAAIGAGTPGIVIAHDSRTGELAETMHLPQVDIKDVQNSTDLRQVIAATRFDGPKFDAWRSVTARRYAAAMKVLGLDISGGVAGLAGQDQSPAGS
jgi:hypothetical protein